jgi:dihydroorotase
MASVSALHLLCTEMDVSNFNSSFKVLPVLRSEADRIALISGIEQGTIELISSNHVPQCTESKDLEFPLSAFGSTGMTITFAASRKATFESVSLEKLVSCFTTAPRKVLQIDDPKIAVGQVADLTVFDPDIEWTLGAADQQSKSSNAALLNRDIKGKALGVIMGKHSTRLY